MSNDNNKNQKNEEKKVTHEFASCQNKEKGYKKPKIDKDDKEENKK